MCLCSIITTLTLTARLFDLSLHLDDLARFQVILHIVLLLFHAVVVTSCLVVFSLVFLFRLFDEHLVALGHLDLLVFKRQAESNR